MMLGLAFMLLTIAFILLWYWFRDMLYPLVFNKTWKHRNE